MQAAQERLRTDLSEARAALTAARQAFEEAKADAPRLLVHHLIGEDNGATVADIPEAEAALREGERRVSHGRHAMELLDRELATRQQHLHLAEHDLDAAVAAVVLTDPQKQCLLDEFFRSGRQTLKLAQCLRTLRLTVTGVNSDECGLALRLLDQTRPGSNGHASAFTPDAAFSMALADLRNDADVPLPDLPAHPPSAA